MSSISAIPIVVILISAVIMIANITIIVIIVTIIIMIFAITFVCIIVIFHGRLHPLPKSELLYQSP